MMENLLDFIVGGSGDRCMVSFIQHINIYTHTHSLTHVVVASHMHKNEFITSNFRAKRFFLVGHSRCSVFLSCSFFCVVRSFVHFSVIDKRARARANSVFLHPKIAFGFGQYFDKLNVSSSPNELNFA